MKRVGFQTPLQLAVNKNACSEATRRSKCRRFRKYWRKDHGRAESAKRDFRSTPKSAGTDIKKSTFADVHYDDIQYLIVSRRNGECLLLKDLRFHVDALSACDGSIRRP